MTKKVIYYLSGPALCVIFSPRDYLSAPRRAPVIIKSSSPPLRGEGGNRMAAASAVFKERDAGAFAFLLTDAAIYGAGFSKSWKRVWID